MPRALSLFAAVALAAGLAGAALAQTSPISADIPAAFAPATSAYDYVRREVMIPMRDGVKLYTVIVIPKGARDAPIVLTRTPLQRQEAGSADHLSAHALQPPPG